MSEPLYDRIGGEAAVMAAVDLFYQKIMADELTRPFFAGLDIEAQVKKQVSFMTWAFGGPSDYKGRDLRTAHAGLVKKGLSDVHFDAVAGHLVATLNDLGVAPDLIQEAIGIVGSQRDAVLNR